MMKKSSIVQNTKGMGVETRRAAAGGRTKKSTPPIFSHEFVIQNHGDIMSCILMVFIIGLMFPLTAAMSAVFIAPQYNQTVNVTTDQGPGNLVVYTNGVKDVFTIAFYTVAWVVVHAVIQEYILDKLQRKTHLSKVKTFKFTESGHQVLFALYSAIHAAYVIMEFVQTHADIKRIWLGYPEEHRWMSLNMKMFAILQIAYWFHQFPEFYFQKFKKEEMRQRAFVSIVYIAFITVAYFMNFMRVACALLLLEYTSQTVFHFARLVHFMDKKNVSKSVFKVWNFLFILVRLLSAVLTVTTFWYGLRQSESAFIDVSAGNFNTTTIRLNCLLTVLALQLFQLCSFISFHVGRFKDGSSRKKTEKKVATPKPKKVKQQDDSETEVSEETKKANKKKN